MAKILVTGGAGFVGYQLTKFLSARAHEVVIADNLSRGKKDDDLEALLELPNVVLKEVDLTDRTAWSTLGQGFDYVYHLASINGTKLFYEMPHEVLRGGIFSCIYSLISEIVVGFFLRSLKNGAIASISSVAFSV